MAKRRPTQKRCVLAWEVGEEDRLYGVFGPFATPAAARQWVDKQPAADMRYDTVPLYPRSHKVDPA